MRSAGFVTRPVDGRLAQGKVGSSGLRQPALHLPPKAEPPRNVHSEGAPCSTLSPWAAVLVVQVDQNRVFFQVFKELVGTFLLVGNHDVAIDVFAVAGTGGNQAAHNDVFLEAA